jgi:polyribonucleotide nucleotidyltransferase
MIRSIIERTGVKIDVEDDGRVNVASADEESAKKAIAIIMELTATAELNKTYMGKVQRITDFGAFVEIIPGTDGLLHVSEIARHRVQDVRDELKEGDQLLVKVISIDPSGKIRLSRKALLAEEEGGESGGSGEASQDRPSDEAPRPPRPHGDSHDRGPGGRGGRPGGRDRRR